MKFGIFTLFIILFFRISNLYASGAFNLSTGGSSDVLQKTLSDDINKHLPDKEIDIDTKILYKNNKTDENIACYEYINTSRKKRASFDGATIGLYAEFASLRTADTKFSQGTYDQNSRSYYFDSPSSGTNVGKTSFYPTFHLGYGKVYDYNIFFGHEVTVSASNIQAKATQPNGQILTYTATSLSGYSMKIGHLLHDNILLYGITGLALFYNDGVDVTDQNGQKLQTHQQNGGKSVPFKFGIGSDLAINDHLRVIFEGYTWQIGESSYQVEQNIPNQPSSKSQYTLKANVYGMRVGMLYRL